MADADLKSRPSAAVKCGLPFRVSDERLDDLKENLS